MRERKERIKNDRRIFGLGYCKFGVTINKMGILEVKETGKDFLPSFPSKMSIRRPSGNAD